MTWAKLDDGFWMHPKIVLVGNTAAGVFARMLSYAGCYLTEGHVPHNAVAAILGADGDKVLEDLERVQMIERLETGSIFIPDFLEHNRSKAQVEADREQRREAGRRGGTKSARVRRAAA